MTIVSYTPYFVKKFSKLPLKVKNQAVQKELVFKKNIKDKRLKTHKLAGKLAQYYSFSINHQYRVMFHITAQGEVVFVDVGTHAIYK